MLCCNVLVYAKYRYLLNLSNKLLAIDKIFAVGTINA